MYPDQGTPLLTLRFYIYIIEHAQLLKESNLNLLERLNSNAIQSVHHLQIRIRSFPREDCPHLSIMELICCDRIIADHMFQAFRHLIDLSFHVECAASDALVSFAHPPLCKMEMPSLEMVQVALEYNGPVNDNLREFEFNWDADLGWGCGSKHEAYDLSGARSFVIVTYTWQKPRSGATTSAIRTLSIKCSG